MKNELKISLVALLSVAVVACSSDKNDKKDGQPTVSQQNIPAALNFQKPAKGSELTKQQVAKIRAAIGVRSQMILPPGDLVFPSNGTTSAELAQKEAELRQKDPNAYQLLLETRQTCGRPHPNVNFDATFPTDAPITAKSFEKGDKVSYGGSAALLGQRCVVGLSAGVNLGATVTGADHGTSSVGGSTSSSANLSFVMKNQKYAQLLGARGLIMTTNLSGLAVVRELGPKAKTGRGLFNYGLSGTFLSLTADIPYSLKYQALIDGHDEKTQTVESIATTTVQVPGAPATIVAHFTTIKVEGKEDVTTGEIYVNGYQKTPKELEELFGNSSQVATQGSPAINGLR